jgi:DNA-binding transcriptional LysR family regulator
VPDLDLLATFLEIYRGGSITAAASRRGLSQPAVSGQLARLEEQFGEPLFVRSRRGAVPTERAYELAPGGSAPTSTSSTTPSARPATARPASGAPYIWPDRRT